MLLNFQKVMPIRLRLKKLKSLKIEIGSWSCAHLCNTQANCYGSSQNVSEDDILVYFDWLDFFCFFIQNKMIS